MSNSTFLIKIFFLSLLLKLKPNKEFVSFYHDKIENEK